METTTAEMRMEIVHDPEHVLVMAETYIWQLGRQGGKSFHFSSFKAIYDKETGLQEGLLKGPGIDVVKHSKKEFVVGNWFLIPIHPERELGLFELAWFVGQSQHSSPTSGTPYLLFAKCSAEYILTYIKDKNQLRSEANGGNLTYVHPKQCVPCDPHTYRPYLVHDHLRAAQQAMHLDASEPRLMHNHI